MSKIEQPRSGTRKLTAAEIADMYGERFTEERVTQLKQLWLAGVSPSAISRQLGNMRVPEVTQTAMLLGLPSRSKTTEQFWEQDGRLEKLKLLVERGFTFKEIADFLGTSRNHVAGKVFRLRRSGEIPPKRETAESETKAKDLATAREKSKEEEEKRLIKIPTLKGQRLAVRKLKADERRSLLSSVKDRIYDDWVSFGILDSTREGENIITFRSSNGDRVQLVKRYSPNWEQVLHKGRALQGEHVAIRLVQNYANTKPRAVDIMVADGIMSSLKPNPFFEGLTEKKELRKPKPKPEPPKRRYEWVRVGPCSFFESDLTLGITAEETGKTWVHFKQTLPEEMENRLHNCLDAYEGESLLVCIDHSSEMKETGIPTFVDAHPEEQGLSIYAEDHNTILETISYVTKEAEDKKKTLEKQKRDLHEEMMRVDEEYKRQQSTLDERFRETEKTVHLIEGQFREEVKQLEIQEQLLSQYKESLHQYGVEVLAAARDKQKRATAIEMKGFAVVGGIEATAEAEVDRGIYTVPKPKDDGSLQRLIDKIQQDDVDVQPKPENDEEAEEQIKVIKQAMEQAHARGEQQKWQMLREVFDQVERDRRRKSITEKPVEQAAPSVGPNEDIVTDDDIIAGMFDNSQQMPPQLSEMLQAMMDKVDRMVSSNEATNYASKISEHELQNLRDFVREEQEELGEDDDKTARENAIILSKVDEIISHKEPIAIKVSPAHPRAALALRYGINMEEAPVRDRLRVNFLKHVSKSAFIVELVDYRTKAHIMIVPNSKDSEDLALKSCIHMGGPKWKEIQDRIVPTGGKRLVGVKMKKLLAWHEQIKAEYDATS